MKISKFCWGIELSDAVKYLGIYGMVMSVLGIIGGAFLFAFLLGLQSYLTVGSAIFLLLIYLGWFYFSYLLNKKNTSNDVEGVKKMVKIGCYVIASVQVVASAVGVITGIIFITIPQFSRLLHIMGIVMIVVGGIWLIFPSLLLHGIRTRSPGKIKPWIIFKFVIFALTLSLGLVSEWNIPLHFWHGDSS